MPRAWRALNTDFPNYYLSARLAYEGYDTSRMYEWPWIEREKDHRAIDIRVIGLVPITPFSTLAVWPLAGLKPLAAKHIWILLNLCFLIPIAWMLRSMTHLSFQRIALIFALNFPLHRNLLFGQFYILLLLLIVAACWAYLRDSHAVAGVLVAVAAACKIFPVVFFVFFLRRKDWRALIWGAVSGLAAAALSVAIFGWNAHRTYLHEILPWTLHGEAMPPYVATASISGVLHRLFLYEPQWNPHPWHASPLCFALLRPTLEMFVIAPAILLIGRDNTRETILLEWSALLSASLAVTPLPTVYDFVLMAFPACVLVNSLLQRKRYGWLALMLIAYVVIGLPTPILQGASGFAILLPLLRLPLVLALLFGIYMLLWRKRPLQTTSLDWARYVWAIVLAALAISSIFSTHRRESAARQEYAYRLPLQAMGLLNASPQASGTRVSYVAFTFGGYHLLTEDRKEGPVSWPTTRGEDDLSFTGGQGTVWAERVFGTRSEIADMQQTSHVVVKDAREPILSVNRQDLAFVRDDHGRGQLIMREAFTNENAKELALTPSSLNVYEASFLSRKEYAFSAVESGQPPKVYLNDAIHANAPLSLGESRYPALSPDGQWMAYSRLEHGVWNLWLRDEKSGATRRIADVPCNQIQPAWEADSKTLLYSTDCGRNLWFTAVSRRKVLF